MSVYDDFIETTRAAGEHFLEQSRDTPVLVVSHIDTDALCATAILVKALEDQGFEVNTLHVPHINEETIDLIKEQNKGTLVCADIGSAFLDTLADIEGTVLVIDHHQPHGEASNVTQINPYVMGIDETNSISAAGIAYFFAMGLHPDNKKLAHVGVIGAIGDTQLNREIRPLNDRILKYAVVQKTVRAGRRLRLHGIYNRPLTKILEYSNDLDIPGVTGNPEGVLDLLDELHIQPEWKGRPRRFYQLNTEEKKSLTRKIIELKDDEDVFIATYSLQDEDCKPLRDLREYATILNACGRLEKYDVAIDALLGNADAKDEAVEIRKEYKTALHVAMKYKDEHSDMVHDGDGYILLDYGINLKQSLVGITASMLARNNRYNRGDIVCSLADDGETTKISLRISHDVEGQQLDQLLDELVQPFGSRAGGHDNAAGATIPTKDKEAFIESFVTKMQN